jgi:hypothetical protein
MPIGVANVEIPTAVVLILDAAVEANPAAGELGCKRVDIVDIDIKPSTG